ncbi:MAG: N(4)-(beta-N-acetylglucosaminyl)-L-asparaginase [Phycisphaerae bacterium]|nr:N(4)-(beta-N-acetylglucosaminyl)-L-asparaginase [Phycisphaerae bacterium]
MAKIIAIATWDFGKAAVAKSGEILATGGTAIDAVEKGINVAELDTNIVSVGYGGMPNATGEMEFDAAIMNGRTHAVGSVATLTGYSRPISVARAVMEKCQHSMLVGDGARKFATEQGFAIEETLSEESKKKYSLWLADKNAKPEFMHDTIGLLAMDCRGELVAGCSTSGMAFKHPGRVGDSPLIGSGLYADIEAGAAAATGNGDEILKFCMSFLTVEFMRNGDSAMQACQNVIKRFVAQHPEKINEDVNLIALSADGHYGAATLRDSFAFGLWDGAQARCQSVKRI